MSLKRRGIRKHTFTPVTWAVECPLHPGELHIEYPIGRIGNSAKAEAMAELFYCPQDDGHTFPIEDAKVTTYDAAGNVEASGLTLLDVVAMP
jgi:hypothetical protein